jgi:hypothetical protein
MRKFHVLLTGLQSDVFCDEIRNRIVAAFGADGVIAGFYASQANDPAAHSQTLETVKQDLMKSA